ASIAHGNEMFRRADEIAEGVRLFAKFSIGVPVPALIGDAANMGDRTNEAAMGEAEAIGGKRSRQVRAISAVAVKQQRGGSIEPRTVPVKDRDGNLFAVRGDSEQPPRHILRGIVTRGNDLTLAQDPFAG